jgi:O-antigen ligase
MIHERKWFTVPFSFTLLIPTLWLVLQNSKGILFWKETIDLSLRNQFQFEGSPVDRIILIILIIISSFILYIRRGRLLVLMKSNIWIFFFFTYMLITILWADYPFIAIKRWIKAFGTIMIFCIIFTENNPLKRAIDTLRFACFIVLPISLFYSVFIPSVGQSFSTDDGIFYWLGITTHKNMLGQWATLGILIFFWQLITDNQVKSTNYVSAIMLIISLVLLVGSKSTTSIVITLIGLAVFLVFYIIKYIGRVGFLTIPIILITGILFVIMFQQLFLDKPVIVLLLNMAGKDLTFTGRSGLWDCALSFGSQKLIFGHGYATFWISKWGDDIRSVLGWDMYSSHNGFIDVFLQFGLVGTFLNIIFILIVIYSVINVYRYNFNFGILWVSVFFVTFISNFSESNFGILTHEYWYLSILISFILPINLMQTEENSG